MATVTISIPDSLVPRLKAAMNWKFPDTVGQPDAAAFKAKTGEYWKDILVEYEVHQAYVAEVEALRGAQELARLGAETDGGAIG